MSRRPPLGDIGANSPLRGGNKEVSLMLQAKGKRTRDEYAQPPPIKKQILDNRSQQPVRSPSTVAQRSRPLATIHSTRSRPVTTTVDPSLRLNQEKELLNWQKQQRAKFPGHIFFLDAVPADVGKRLRAQIAYLGAREEKFFSIDVTHVVTTRALPPPKVSTDGHSTESSHSKHEAEGQPQTINPSLLDCSSESRRKMLMDLGSRRAQAQDDLVKLKAAKNTDILYKAQNMGKRIYTIEKLQRILDSLLAGDEQASKSLHMRQLPNERNLAKLLERERMNGPSDRDPRAVMGDIHCFRGPYIYVYDMNEKTRPVMAREYPKVADKSEGEWPQFKTVTQGRCPFVDEVQDIKLKRLVEKKGGARETDKMELEKDKSLKTGPSMPSKRMVGKLGKRPRDEFADPLAESKDGQNRAASVRPTEMFHPPKDLRPKDLDFASRNQKFFTGRNGNTRMIAGEAVASGIQPSNITSAIRSQVVSSNANAPGAKAGTSKEVQNLQRQVLSRANSASQDPSSRRVATGQSMDGPSSRLASFAKPAGRVLESLDETRGTEKMAAAQVKPQSQPLVRKAEKDMKPGYCENCLDKFSDFDEHIVSRKHRKFAESRDNWVDLDDLISLLQRKPRYPQFQGGMAPGEGDVRTPAW